MLKRLIWPLPALLAWAAGWAVFVGTIRLGATEALAWMLASGLGLALSLWGSSWWRRSIISLGFPLSCIVLLGTGGLPTWSWLVLLLILLLIYPVNAWRDAPLFPTPLNALEGLPTLAPLPVDTRVLDAGCGLGHGLQALRRAYPQAQLNGIEWSWPLRFVCALRCPWARVRQGDIWQASWQDYALVYLFQRPETMPRAVAKAQAELQTGAWLASLEFEAQTLKPKAQARTPDGRIVWLYQVPFVHRP